MKTNILLSTLNYKRICKCGTFNVKKCVDCENYFISIYKTYPSHVVDTHIIELIIYNHGIKEDIVINGKKVSDTLKRTIFKLMTDEIVNKPKVSDDGCFTWEDYENNK